jgi:cholesterol transport system auxiliary component
MAPSKLVPAALAAFALAGCTVLGLPRAEAPKLFTLGATFDGVAPRGEPAQAILVAASAARPGYDSVRMVYVTRAYELQFFARHEWVAPPAQMLTPLLVEALERGGKFRAVQSPAHVVPALRLETEIIALQQEFTVRPSQIRFVLRAGLVDVAKRRVVAIEEFEAVEPAPSEDPYGGVVAANHAVSRVLGELAKWCEGRAPSPTAVD